MLPTGACLLCRGTEPTVRGGMPTPRIYAAIARKLAGRPAVEITFAAIGGGSLALSIWVPRAQTLSGLADTQRAVLFVFLFAVAVASISILCICRVFKPDGSARGWLASKRLPGMVRGLFLWIYVLLLNLGFLIAAALMLIGFYWVIQA